MAVAVGEDNASVESAIDQVLLVDRNTVIVNANEDGWKKRKNQINIGPMHRKEREYDKQLFLLLLRRRLLLSLLCLQRLPRNICAVDLFAAFI